ncbi:MAG TPA: ribosomal-protein-alanine N-acetyltransferase [Eubacteriaceae bacterium]|nr:ribosomal-protein-alanine N-acetyltransferase [Eubacteriaceae bacterium]
MNKVRIEPLSTKDLEELIKIEKDTFSQPWTKAMFCEEIDNPIAVYFVAKDDRSVYGYIGLWKIGDEGHITNIAVSEEYRGEGIGRALLARMLQFGKEAGIVAFTLEVRKSNIRAIQFYKSFDFQVAGVRKGYYQDNGEDGLIMWRRPNA